MTGQSSPLRRTLSAVAAGAAVLAACAMGTGSAGADPAPRAGCTAGDLAGVASAVAASISVYLLTHPDVNAFYTSLHTMAPEQKADAVRTFFAGNPHQNSELVTHPFLDCGNYLACQTSTVRE